MLNVARNADGRLRSSASTPRATSGTPGRPRRTTELGRQLGRLYTNNDALTSLRVMPNADGRLEVFGINAQGHIWHTWQTAPNNGWVGSWAELYSNADSLAMLDVAHNADGRLEVFGVNGQGHIWHTWQTTPTATGSVTPYLHLAEQYQVESEWCWSATTVSITHYYDAAATWTQCSLVNKAFGQTTCCQNGSSAACNQPWYPDQALTITGHLASTASGEPSFQTVMNEINDGHPCRSRLLEWRRRPQPGGRRVLRRSRDAHDRPSGSHLRPIDPGLQLVPVQLPGRRELGRVLLHEIAWR